MGIIDKLWFKFTCPSCGKAEVTAVTDKGSSFGGWDWGSVHSTELFSVTSTGGGKIEPEVTGAACKVCEVAAMIEARHGFGYPKDF
jgi:transcription elongation factor Elf1